MRLATAVLLAFLAAGPAYAQAPDTENGRYVFSQRPDGGWTRLDTRTGAVSICSQRADRLACMAVADDRKALGDEIGRLQAENQRLRQALEERGGVPPALAERPRETPRGWPSDREMDEAFNYMERLWRRMMDFMASMHRGQEAPLRNEPPQRSEPAPRTAP